MHGGKGCQLVVVNPGIFRNSYVFMKSSVYRCLVPSPGLDEGCCILLGTCEFSRVQFQGRYMIPNSKP